MDFSLPRDIEQYRQRISAFVEERILPLEQDRANYDEHENIVDHHLQRLRGEVREAGLWSPQMPRYRGGMGLSMVGMAACYEAMNRSIFGPVCFNAVAPDDGNMMVLEKVATEAQKTRWLQPIVDGRVRSAFALTEPHPGAGSDMAGMMQTRAERRGDRWVINGHKWFITGAGLAEHFMLVARTSDDARKGLTVFLFHRDQPGWEIRRRIPIMGPEEHGGHCELIFDGLEIPDDQVLLGVGEGMKVAQTRLAPARLTHCMRWLGLARRAMEEALGHVETRQAFGSVLADNQSIQTSLGEVAMEIEIGRTLVMKAAWALDQGSFARKEISMAKVAVSNVLNKAVDVAIQVHGAKGYSQDTVLEWIYRYARQARIVDGATEVHQMLMARMLRSEGNDFWRWEVAGE